MQGEKKAFDKIQHQCMIKLTKLGIEGIYLSTVKVTCKKPMTSQQGKLKSLSCKVWKKTRTSMLTRSIQQSIESPCHSRLARNELKGIQLGKEKFKLSVY